MGKNHQPQPQPSQEKKMISTPHGLVGLKAFDSDCLLDSEEVAGFGMGVSCRWLIGWVGDV